MMYSVFERICLLEDRKQEVIEFVGVEQKLRLKSHVICFILVTLITQVSN